MEPASAALTLWAAAISVAKGIDKIRVVRKHPKKCKELWAEIGDLVVELKLGDDLTRGNKNVEDQCRKLGVFQKVEAAKAILDELKEAMEKASSPIGLTSSDGMKAFWNAYVHGKNKVDWCRDELRKIREGLSFSLQSLQAPTVFQVDIKVDALANGQKNILATQQQIFDYLKSTCVASIGSGRRPTLPPSYDATISQDMTRHPRRSLREPQPGIKDIGLLQLPVDEIGKYCRAWCSCTCHTPTSINSYKGLKNVFGAITVTHSGLPGFSRRKCSEKHCRRMAALKVRFQYAFPRLIWQRRIDIMYSSAIFGPEVRIKLPRVVDWTSPVWQQATLGNVAAVRTLFRQGLASPWDVSPLGGNLLHYATDHWNADLCRLLLEEAHVDPTAEDDFKGTAVSIAWERVLSGKMSANDASIVANLFKDTDYLASRSFTLIHKIVLGLNGQDLDTALESSTSQIDIKDSRGRTPLSWAAARGDEDSVRTLLKHKADPNISDICAQFPLHYVQNTACAQLLIENTADLDVLNSEGQTPLYTACRNIGSASLTQFLISANDGAHLEKKDFSQQTPLHAAAANGRYLPFIDNLLEAGADVNTRNNSGDSPTRFTIMFNMHDLILRMLKDPSIDARFDSININGQSFAHTIARTADIETVRILADARPTTLEADMELQDISGKTSLEYFEERLATLPLDDQLELKEAFEHLTKVLSEPSENKQICEVDIESVMVDVPSTGKFEVQMRISSAEKNEVVVSTEELFHDAVQTF